MRVQLSCAARYWTGQLAQGTHLFSPKSSCCISETKGLLTALESLPFDDVEDLGDGSGVGLAVELEGTV
jgi:hypothetical protein